MEKIRLNNYIGDELEEDFANFDLTEIKDVLDTLANYNTIDIAHSEMLQQKSLRGADIISEYLGKVVKTTSYLESKINATKNKVALEYQAPEGIRTTAEMKKNAGESSLEVEALQIRLGKAKAGKIVLEKKYELLLKAHYFYKEITMSFIKTLGVKSVNSEDVAEGYR